MRLIACLGSIGPTINTQVGCPPYATCHQQPQPICRSQIWQTNCLVTCSGHSQSVEYQLLIVSKITVETHGGNTILVLLNQNFVEFPLIGNYIFSHVYLNSW